MNKPEKLYFGKVSPRKKESGATKEGINEGMQEKQAHIHIIIKLKCEESYTNDYSGVAFNIHT